ncbi:MAG: metallophosphoesterase family protein [Phormidesmis sp.]
MQSNNLPSRTLIEPPVNRQSEPLDMPKLLSDPFLQLPTSSTVQVVWFTEFAGIAHTVEYGEGMSAIAITTQLSRTREDSSSKVAGRNYSTLTARPIWRHEASITGLTPNARVAYRIKSRDADERLVMSDSFTLSAAPQIGQPLTILLTSDHQLKPLTPANLQKVGEIADRVDAVFFAGDLVNVPDRASEWFDDARGLALFPGLQGRAAYDLAKTTEKNAKKNAEKNTEKSTEKAGTSHELTTRYTGAQLIQHAPLFPVIGNHEVMGRYSDSASLDAQFNNPLPRQRVNAFYPAPEGVPASEWIKDHSYNTQTYEEIFSLPTATLADGSQTSTYYATTFGDVRLVSLYVTQIWRSPELSPETKGRYREKADALNAPETWGYGQHIFEDIRQGSLQYQWLQQELASDAFKSAKYKIVMLHHPPHTLGGNIAPPFTDPILVENRSDDGTLQSIQYEYPPEDDYIIRDLMPLLESADVQLVFYGHSHLWNRFVSPQGMHFLETSNVGNSYGAHTAGNPRDVPTDEKVAVAGDLTPFDQTYSAVGDPNGLAPVMPSISPLTDKQGDPLPYIASNDVTSFTLFDTGSGTLSSYYFDTREPDSAVVKFDEFTIGPREQMGQ